MVDLGLLLSSPEGNQKFLIAGAFVLLSIVALAKDWIGDLRLKWKLSKYPIVNPTWGVSGEAQKTYMKSAKTLLQQGFDKYKGKPFRLNDFSQSGAKLILSPKYIDEIKSVPSLDFSSFVVKDFYANYPGFEAFRPGDHHIMHDAIRKSLAQVLSLTIQPMALELPKTLEMNFGKPKEWTEVVFYPPLLNAVSRLTSRIFLGEKFMDDPDWQYIAQRYTTNAFMAALDLNNTPPFLRPIVHWFLPSCQKLRSDIKKARSLIAPEVKQRLDDLKKNGAPRRRVLDSVDWFVTAAKGQPFDYAVAEISLAMASIHTTSRTTMTLFHDLIKNPEFAQPLRDELIAILKETGKMDKNALFKMRKMDAFLKESLRMHAGSLSNMPRLAQQDLTFKDGTHVPKGTYIMISPMPMRDPELYPNPDKFDGNRFLKLRDQPGNENKFQSVTTDTNFTFFGHGIHACPGRFFATNEIKLLFAYMIMHYEFKLPDGVDFPTDLTNGTFQTTNPNQKLMYRTRVPELDLMDYVPDDNDI